MESGHLVIQNLGRTSVSPDGYGREPGGKENVESPLSRSDSASGEDVDEQSAAIDAGKTGTGRKGRKIPVCDAVKVRLQSC